MKRTLQRHSKLTRARTHGFRKRSRTQDGRKILANRRRKGRWSLAPTGGTTK